MNVEERERKTGLSNNRYSTTTLTFLPRRQLKEKKPRNKESFYYPRVFCAAGGDPNVSQL